MAPCSERSLRRNESLDHLALYANFLGENKDEVEYVSTPTGIDKLWGRHALAILINEFCHDSPEKVESAVFPWTPAFVMKCPRCTLGVIPVASWVLDTWTPNEPILCYLAGTLSEDEYPDFIRQRVFQRTKRITVEYRSGDPLTYHFRIEGVKFTLIYHQNEMIRDWASAKKSKPKKHLKWQKYVARLAPDTLSELPNPFKLVEETNRLADRFRNVEKIAIPHFLLSKQWAYSHGLMDKGDPPGEKGILDFFTLANMVVSSSEAMIPENGIKPFLGRISFDKLGNRLRMELENAIRASPRANHERLSRNSWDVLNDVIKGSYHQLWSEKKINLAGRHLRNFFENSPYFIRLRIVYTTKEARAPWIKAKSAGVLKTNVIKAIVKKWPEMTFHLWPAPFHDTANSAPTGTIQGTAPLVGDSQVPTEYSDIYYLACCGNPFNEHQKLKPVVKVILKVFKEGYADARFSEDPVTLEVNTQADASLQDMILDEDALVFFAERVPESDEDTAPDGDQTLAISENSASLNHSSGNSHASYTRHPSTPVNFVKPTPHYPAKAGPSGTNGAVLTKGNENKAPEAQLGYEKGKRSSTPAREVIIRIFNTGKEGEYVYDYGDGQVTIEDVPLKNFHLSVENSRQDYPPTHCVHRIRHVTNGVKDTIWESRRAMKAPMAGTGRGIARAPSVQVGVDLKTHKTVYYD